MIATHGPTLVIHDREGRANYFILRRDETFPLPRWSTHSVSLFGPTNVFPFGMARVVAPEGRSCTVAPGDSTKHPLELLAAELERVGIVAEHLRGEEAWPT